VSLPTTLTSHAPTASNSLPSEESLLPSSASAASTYYPSHHNLFLSNTLFSAQPSLHLANPTPPTGLPSSYDPPPPVSASLAHKNLAVIIFATIGGITGLTFLALFIRQAIAYHRLPRHVVALTAADREQLVREMAEAEAASWRRHQSCPIPPPPYEHAPSYESLEVRTD